MTAPTSDALAEAIDPDAFQQHPVERRREAAALQWGARRLIAREHADAARAHIAAVLADPETVEAVESAVSGQAACREGYDDSCGTCRAVRDTATAGLSVVAARLGVTL